jgi:hypothetical protein
MSGYGTASIYGLLSSVRIKRKVGQIPLVGKQEQHKVAVLFVNLNVLITHHHLILLMIQRWHRSIESSISCEFMFSCYDET